MTSVKSREVVAFEDLLSTSLQNFINASENLGEPITSLSLKVKEAFLKSRDLIEFGLVNNEQPEEAPIMKSFFGTIKAIVDCKCSDTQFANHFATVKEAIIALGWISVKPAPTQFIRNMNEAGQYYSNRVLLSNKGNEKHANWVKHFHELLIDLEKFVKENFLTGFTWAANAAKSATGLPPPPPPPALPAFDLQACGDGSRQALLNDLNQGAAITRNLRPVNRAPQTGHASTVKTAPSPVKAASILKAPKLLLEGRKWIVEHQIKSYNITIPIDDYSQSLAVFKCQDSGIQVSDKMNSVVIDCCERLSIVLKSIIASVELIRCDRIKLQCDGHVPFINLDNCDSVDIFVTPASKSVEVVSSKSNSCNLCILQPDGDYEELPIPSQIRTVLKGEKLESTIVEQI